MIKFKYEGLPGAAIMVHNTGKTWSLMRWYFWAKQDKECSKCKKEFSEDKMELHHINAKCKGGKEEEENMQMLCKLCHRTKMIEIYN